MGITGAESAARYWGYAAQCLIVAQRQDNVADRLILLNMAQAWAALAEQTEREIPEIRRPEGPLQLLP
jgi:hypothetical protein